MVYALVVQGVVVQVQDKAAVGFVEAPGDVIPGYLYDGQAWSLPVPDLAEVQQSRRTQVATVRWQRQVAGYQHSDGHTYHSDVEGRASVSQAVQWGQVYESINGPGTFAIAAWKTQDGAFVGQDLNSLIAIGTGLAAWIDAHFDREQAICAAIDAAGSPAEAEAVDITAGWPS
ncbi:protein of unknown function [Tistlia consotensis]|uniref:DUF4376 domain-containing protein n=1 Tax=Tistlia consotensis USBA 355 TaxID=560819 RepID=A0A1Y6CNJ1_9PROT|nr:DUF4376 domain-containing protein [Tistlia consotensis]SMF77498.1 protein of unknown function [Tistlia consotensis USBA 355]SMF83814.1 protein of unknown function [Tistlia consotensis USBA 355]SNS34533.1 protein of unknown function [Tistlia consotensis]